MRFSWLGLWLLLVFALLHDPFLYVDERFSPPLPWWALTLGVLALSVDAWSRGGRSTGRRRFAVEMLVGAVGFLVCPWPRLSAAFVVLVAGAGVRRGALRREGELPVGSRRPGAVGRRATRGPGPAGRGGVEAAAAADHGTAPRRAAAGADRRRDAPAGRCRRVGGRGRVAVGAGRPGVSVVHRHVREAGGLAGDAALRRRARAPPSRPDGVEDRGRDQAAPDRRRVPAGAAHRRVRDGGGQRRGHPLLRAVAGPPQPRAAPAALGGSPFPAGQPTSRSGGSPRAGARVRRRSSRWRSACSSRSRTTPGSGRTGGCSSTRPTASGSGATRRSIEESTATRRPTTTSPWSTSSVTTIRWSTATTG